MRRRSVGTGEPPKRRRCRTIRSNRGGILATIAILLIALEASGLSRPRSAGAEEACLSTPNSQAPQGSHWYFHIDHAKQRNCWYLRELRQKAPTTQRTVAAPEPSVAQSQRAPIDQARLHHGLGQKRPPVGGAARPAGADQVAWPAQPSAADNVVSPAAPTFERDVPLTTPAAKVIWPAPPTFDHATPVTAPADKVVSPDPWTLDHAGTLTSRDTMSSADIATRSPVEENTTAEVMKPVEGVHRSAANVGENAEKDISSDRKPLTNLVASHRDLPVSTLFGLAIGLVLAGIVLRRIVKMVFGKPRAAYRQPVSINNVGRGRDPTASVRQHPHTAYGRINGNRREKTRHAFQELLQILEQQAV